MAFAITSETGQQITVTVFGLTDDQTRVELDGITVTVASGDATFSQEPGTPTAFTALAGTEGETLYNVVGHQPHGPDVADTVAYTVTAGAVVEPVATSLGFEAGEAEPQGPGPDQGLPVPQPTPGRPTQLPAQPKRK